MTDKSLAIIERLQSQLDTVTQQRDDLKQLLKECSTHITASKPSKDCIGSVADTYPYVKHDLLERIRAMKEST